MGRTEQRRPPPPRALARRRLDRALRLGRRSAYDAAYVVLASELGAELWTLDGPLARNAADHDLPVRLAG